jgi:hypothetical protein
MEAPQGLVALLYSGNERRRAVLQIEAEGRPAVSFGEIVVTRPWLALLFVDDGHLWVHHPELAETPGWKLAA